MIPAMTVVNRAPARAMKMVSSPPASTVPVSTAQALPIRPTRHAQARLTTIQMVATRLEILRSLGFLMAVYLTTMWGIPK